MISTNYNENTRSYSNTATPDNRGVEQGVLQQAANERAVSFAKMLELRDAAQNNRQQAAQAEEEKVNPAAAEVMESGLASLFGAATGLDGIEMAVEAFAKGAEFYDEFARDRASTAAPQPDPRLHGAFAAPTPGYGMAMAA